MVTPKHYSGSHSIILFGHGALIFTNMSEINSFFVRTLHYSKLLHHILLYSGECAEPVLEFIGM